jgi:hypothetical protein
VLAVLYWRSPNLAITPSHLFPPHSVPYRAIGSVFFNFDHADCFERRTAWTAPSFPPALFHDEYKMGLLPSEETLIIYSSAFKQQSFLSSLLP